MSNQVVTLNAALRQNCLKNPGKVFIRYRHTAMTYEELGWLVLGFSEFLKELQVKKNDRICLVLPRVPELCITMLAASDIGALCVPVNYTTEKPAVTAFIKHVHPKVTVVYEKLLPLVDLKPFAGTIVVVETDSKIKHGHIPWKSACYKKKGTVEAKSNPNDLAYLNYTTGSTSDPKGALATHANLYYNTMSAIEAFNITADDTHLCMFASFAHPHEIFCRALYTGGTLSLLEEINPKTIANTIKDDSVTMMMGIAPLYDMLFSHCSGYNMSALRIAESGGMFTRAEITEGFKNSFGIPVLSVWGSTETSGIALANRPDDYRMDGSMGKPCPYYDIKVIDDNGKEVHDGDTGEMLIRGSAVVSGYIDDNAEFSSDADGFYRSGDLVRKDSDGFYYFIERKSGLLKVAGLKVYPLQIEIVIKQHPSVDEAAVIGIEDRSRGMVPAAFVIVKDGCDLTASDLSQYMRAKLANYMVPRKVEFVSELPKIGSGKIDKKRLKKLFEDGMI
ncbi:class I adenylate-forming enzyme family protein [Candidatus Magnetomonas plexicatena]|uniref:class I adenylate-forming enzyme family protein n=1 Tax=Candidatus Magnetomonas plexicatena TaxID=2552947 RepID=UPI001C7778FB|nr:acyl--CoA ligase [Nitrospirales bacterium LBB_01]